MFFYFHAGSSSVTLPHVNKKMPLPRELGTPALRDSRLNLARRLCSNPGIINCWQNHLSQCKWCFLTIQLNFYTPPRFMVSECLNVFEYKIYTISILFWGGSSFFKKRNTYTGHTDPTEGWGVLGRARSGPHRSATVSSPLPPNTVHSNTQFLPQLPGPRPNSNTHILLLPTFLYTNQACLPASSQLYLTIRMLNWI